MRNTHEEVSGPASLEQGTRTKGAQGKGVICRQVGGPVDAQGPKHERRVHRLSAEIQQSPIEVFLARDLNMMSLLLGNIFSQ